MNYKPLARHLARLEQDAKAIYTAWVASLSDDELDALCKDVQPDVLGAYDAMTDDELERLDSGRMSEAEWQRWIRPSGMHVRASARSSC